MATGRSSQEIGDALLISLRSVANRKVNIFNKGGGANRTEDA